MGRKILIGVLVLLVLIQFFGIEKNVSDNQEFAMAKKYHVPASVAKTLENACNDCHSNKTVYPWYSRIQPLGWWLNNHVNEGKRELNFSEFTTRPIAVQNHKLEEMIETVKEGEMPLPSYTWFGLHSAANLSEAEKSELMDWAQHQMDSLKSIYPRDSLELKRRK